MDVDLNLSLPYMSISDLMVHISTIDDTSKKVEKLKNYADVLNVELIKIKDLKCHSPLCILNLTEAIEMLKKEILRYTGMTPNVVTKEFMPLKGGEPKRKDVLQESSDADKKNWANLIQLGNDNVADKSYDPNKQGFASHGSLSGLIRENVAAYKNPYSRMYNNFNSGKRPFAQRPSGVTIREMPYINNGQYSSSKRVGESKGMNMLEETSDADKKNWASHIQLGNNYVARKNFDTKQGYASGCASHDSSSGLIREVVATYEDPYSRMYNNFNDGQRPFVQFQRPPGVIIQENPYTNNGQYSFGRKVGDTKGMDMLEETSDAGKKNWASYIQVENNNVTDKNSDITKQGYASGCASHGSSSGMIRETVTYENPYGHMYNNFNNGKRSFVQFQGPPNVFIQENSYINNGQYTSDGKVGMSSFNMNFDGGFATNSSYQPSYSPFSIDPSKKPRLSWSQNLHDDFLQAVQHLGGPYVATPKNIREHMQVHNLTNDEVKSHLQKYRLHLQKLAASDPTSLAPSSSRSSLTAQGYEADMFTGTVSEYSAQSSEDPLHTRRV